MGCLGDEGAPALETRDGEMLVKGIYLGQKIGRKGQKEAVFVNLTSGEIYEWLQGELNTMALPDQATLKALPKRNGPKKKPIDLKPGEVF
jgi:hypothetical protein